MTPQAKPQIQTYHVFLMHGFERKLLKQRYSDHSLPAKAQLMSLLLDADTNCHPELNWIKSYLNSDYALSKLVMQIAIINQLTYDPLLTYYEGQTLLATLKKLHGSLNPEHELFTMIATIKKRITDQCNYKGYQASFFGLQSTSSDTHFNRTHSQPDLIFSTKIPSSASESSSSSSESSGSSDSDTLEKHLDLTFEPRR